MEQISCTIVLYTNFVRGALALKSEKKPGERTIDQKESDPGLFQICLIRVHGFGDLRRL